MKFYKTILLLLICTTFKYSPAQNSGSAIKLEPQHYIKLGYGIVQYAALEIIHGNYRLTKDEALTSSLTGPLYVKYEYNSDYDLTIGISFSYEQNKMDTSGFFSNSYYYYNYGFFSFTSYSFLFRLNYLIVPDRNFQPYLGVGLGVRSSHRKNIYRIIDYNNNNTISISETTNSYNGIGADLTFGVNYLIQKGFGIYAEAGLAKSVFQIGIVKCFGNNIP